MMRHTFVTFGSVVLAVSMCLCSTSGYAGDEKKPEDAAVKKESSADTAPANGAKKKVRTVTAA